MKIKMDINLDFNFKELVGAWKHFVTITNHKILVMKGCFQVGLYWQGLLHDLSKYCPSEFWVGARYFQGNRSPNNAEREAIGYSSAWLHHKGRNKHHYEYWVDYSSQAGVVNAPVKMPERYLVEMVMDRIAASKNYLKDAYTDSAPLAYYEKGKNFALLQEDTARELEKLLVMLSQRGEKFTFAYMKRRTLHGKSVCFFDCMVQFVIDMIHNISRGISYYKNR